jgi:hypothetical protein
MEDVLTLYLRPGSAVGVSTRQLVVATIKHPQTGERVVEAKTNTGSVSTGQYVPAPPGGLVVVTYTHNLLIMVSMSRFRMVVREFGGQAPLSLSSAEFQAAAKEAPPPELTSPYDNRCIPNFADIAMKLGLLSTKNTSVGELLSVFDSSVIRDPATGIKYWIQGGTVQYFTDTVYQAMGSPAYTDLY